MVLSIFKFVRKFVAYTLMCAARVESARTKVSWLELWDRVDYDRNRENARDTVKLRI